MSDAARFLTVRDRGARLAIPGHCVADVAPTRGVHGSEDRSLASCAGVADPSATSPIAPSIRLRIEVLGASLDVVIDELLGLADVANDAVLPLPPVFARRRPAIAGLAIVDGDRFLVLNPDALRTIEVPSEP